MKNMIPKVVFLINCLTVSAALAGDDLEIKSTQPVVLQEIVIKVNAKNCEIAFSKHWGGMDTGDKCVLKLDLPEGGQILKGTVVTSDKMLVGYFSTLNNGRDKILTFDYRSEDENVGSLRFDKRTEFISQLKVAFATDAVTLRALYQGPKLK